MYVYPYVTAEELRKTPGLLEIRYDDRGGSRFRGPTEPDLAFKYFTDKKNGQYVESGPVFGKFLEVLQRAGYAHVHAIDFADMLSFGDRQHLTLKIIDLNTEPFPYPDNFFDGHAAWGFGEHLENPYHWMREAHRTLKPDGILLFSLPNMYNIVSRLHFLFRGALPRWHAKNNHIALFPNEVLEKTFLRYFDLVEVQYRKPRISWRPYFFWRFIKRFVPLNQWTGNFVHYVLRKKPFVPFTAPIPEPQK